MMKIFQLAATALAMTVSILPLVVVGGEVIAEDQDSSPQHINDNNNPVWGTTRNLQLPNLQFEPSSPLFVFVAGSPTMDPISEQTIDPLPSPTKPPTIKPTTY